MASSNGRSLPTLSQQFALWCGIGWGTRDFGASVKIFRWRMLLLSVLASLALFFPERSRCKELDHNMELWTQITLGFRLIPTLLPVFVYSKSGRMWIAINPRGQNSPEVHVQDSEKQAWYQVTYAEGLCCDERLLNQSCLLVLPLALSLSANLLPWRHR